MKTTFVYFVFGRAKVRDFKIKSSRTITTETTSNNNNNKLQSEKPLFQIVQKNENENEKKKKKKLSI